MNRNTILACASLLLGGMGMVSCEADKEPVLQQPTEFVLNTPAFADQLYQLASNSVLELTVSQPNYGMALAPEYSVDVSLLEDFGAGQAAPAEGEAPLWANVQVVNPHSAVLTIEEQRIAEAMCAMMGITEDNFESVTINTVPLYVRINAIIEGQPSTAITSNTVKLAQVLTYFQAPIKADLTLWTPGNSNGWNQGNSQQLAQSGEGTFQGFMYINGEFKFTDAPDWNHTNYGYEADGKLSTDGGAGNLPMPATGEGLYFAEVNVNNLSYKLTYIESVGIAGEANSWNQKEPLEMTHSDDFLKWTYTGDLSGQFKFVFNRDWAINLGAPADDLQYGSANLETSGTTKVVLDLSKLPYSCTME